MRVKEVERFEGLVPREGGCIKTKIVRCVHVIGGGKWRSD